MTRINFMNVKIDNLNMSEALTKIDVLIQKKRNAFVVTPNVDHIVKLEKDEELQKVYANADLVLADGKPLIWISKYYRTPIKEKVSGSDLFPKLCELAEKKEYKMFFLGAAEGVAKEAEKNLKERYKKLKIVGTYSPTYGFENNHSEINEIFNIIHKSKPDILIVALGCPKQEKFIYKYRDDLNVPLSLGLGASLDFEAGNVKRAPRWMADNGLEWLFRIMQEPKRMAKRYFIDDIKILYLIKKYRKKN